MASDRSSKDLKDAELYGDEPHGDQGVSSPVETQVEPGAGVVAADSNEETNQDEQAETDSEAGSDTFEGIEVEEGVVSSATRTSLGPSEGEPEVGKVAETERERVSADEAIPVSSVVQEPSPPATPEKKSASP